MIVLALLFHPMGDVNFCENNSILLIGHLMNTVDPQFILVNYSGYIKAFI